MIRAAMLAEHPNDEHCVDGGVQAVTKYLVEALVRTGELDLHVLTFDYGIDKTQTREARGYTRHLIPATRLGAFNAYRQDQLAVDTELESIQPDIVHSQGAGHYGIVATRSAYPTVITIHGIMSEEAKHAPGLRKKFRRWFVSRLSDRYCIGKDKHTILISPYVAEYYGQKLAGSMSVIPNPVAPRFFNIERSEQTGRILFAGRLLPLKGLHDLVVAIASVTKHIDVELVLAGSLDNQKYVAGLESQIAGLELAKVIHFRGILDVSELLQELAQASVLVLPSYQETAPMVIQEAMAAGVPVIATPVGGIPYQIEDGESGLIVKPGDSQHLADCLTSLLRDDALRNSMSVAARHRAESDYRADRIAEQTIRTYQQILAAT